MSLRVKCGEGQLVSRARHVEPLWGVGSRFCDEKRSFCDDAFWYKYDHLLEETGERSSKLDAVNSTPGLRKLLLRL